jgi:hypothetical protein
MNNTASIAIFTHHQNVTYLGSLRTLGLIRRYGTVSTSPKALSDVLAAFDGNPDGSPAERVIHWVRSQSASVQHEMAELAICSADTFAGDLCDLLDNPDHEDPNWVRRVQNATVEREQLAGLQALCSDLPGAVELQHCLATVDNLGRTLVALYPETRPINPLSSQVEDLNPGAWWAL